MDNSLLDPFGDDEENVVELARRLKHEGDKEQNMNTKYRKYLQVRYSGIERCYYKMLLRKMSVKKEDEISLKKFCYNFCLNDYRWIVI